MLSLRNISAMAELFDQELIEAVDTEFIISEDLAAQKLLKEIYSNLKHKPSNELSITEHCWLSSIDELYRNKKASISNKVDWFLQIGHGLIEEENDLNKEEKEMLTAFRRVLGVSSKNNALSTFFTELENSVEALFRLDYSKKTNSSAVLNSDENDLLNYIVMTVDMIRERLGQSVVSGKVVRNVMGRISDIGVLVTDEQGRIRFANDKMDELLEMSSEELMGASINDFVSSEYTLMNASSDVKVDDIDIQQIKVPSVNGEIDEWVYTFSKKVDQDSNIDQMIEIRTIIDDLSACDASNPDELHKLLNVLKTKFSRMEQASIPETGLLKSGLNIRSLINGSFSRINNERNEIEITLDARKNIHYFGDDKELKIIVDQMFTCAIQNLSKSKRVSKLEIVVSSFQHYLLFAFMDNGAIASNYTLINEMRDNVEKIKGTLELNSGRMGNNLSIIIPI